MSVRAITASLAAFFLVTCFAVLLGVTAATLTPLLFILTAGAWLSFVVLTIAALRKPRIGALTERAYIGVIIAGLGTVSCLIVLNTDNGHPFFDLGTASLLFRLAVMAVLFVPTVWLGLWAFGRLGEDA